MVDTFVHHNDNLTTILNFISSIAWPLIVLIIVIIFRSSIEFLIRNIKHLKAPGVEIDIREDDILKMTTEGEVIGKFKVKIAPSKEKPKGKVGVIFQPTEEKEVEVITFQSKEEKESYYKALNRLNEDTKKAGYRRGKLFKVPNTDKWAISWEIKVSDKIIINDSGK